MCCRCCKNCLNNSNNDSVYVCSQNGPYTMEHVYNNLNKKLN